MKKLIFLLAFSVLALPVFGQARMIPTFTKKGFAKATSRSDTSATITLGAYPIAAIQTTTDGTDSANISVHVDGRMFNGLWSNDILVASAVTLGKPTGSSLEAADTGQVANFLLRENTGRIADLLKQCAGFRIRNVLTPGANDSVHTTTYSQSVMLQKVMW